MEIKTNNNESVVYYFDCIESELQKHLLLNYDQIKTNISFKGFRRGYVPLTIFQKFFNTDVLYRKVIESLVNEKIQQILAKNHLKFISEPELIDLKPLPIDFNKNLSFGIKFYLKPKIQIGQYKGLTINYTQIKVTSEDIDNKIHYLLTQKKIYRRKKNNLFLESRDIAILDFKGFLDGKICDNLQAQDFYLQIGCNKLIPNFDESILGMKISESKKIEVLLPLNYYLTDFANKKVIFHVLLKDIQTMPKNFFLTDDVVLSLNLSGINNLEELKTNIKKQINSELEVSVKEKIKEQIIAKIIKNSQINISEGLINQLKTKEIERLKKTMEMRNITLEKYLDTINLSLADFKKTIIHELLYKLKLACILEEIIDKEQIIVLDDEVTKTYNAINNYYPDLANNIGNNSYSWQQVKDHLLQEKVFNFLKDQSFIKTNI